MRDLEDIDLDLLDTVTGGCGGAHADPTPPAAVTSTASDPGASRASTIGFFGHADRAEYHHFGPAPAAGLGSLAGSAAAPATLAAADVGTATDLGAGDQVGSVVCGTVGADAPTDFGDLNVGFDHGSLHLSWD